MGPSGCQLVRIQRLAGLVLLECVVEVKMKSTRIEEVEWARFDNY